MGCGASDDTGVGNNEEGDYDSDVEFEEGLNYERREVDEGTGNPISNEGEQFGAVKPWIGQMEAPSNPPPHDPSKPEQSLKCKYVYGYRCADIRHNLFYTDQKKVVYCVAAIGISMDQNKDQCWFGVGEKGKIKGHSDDIISLSIDQSRTKVCTGQVGKKPAVHWWDANSCDWIGSTKLGKGDRGVKTIGWSCSGRYIGATCLNNDHTVYLIDTQKKGKNKIAGSGKGGDSPFLDMCFSKTDDGCFATIGKRPKYWTYNDGLLEGKGMIMGSFKRSKLIVGTFLENGKLMCGASNGYVYCFAGKSCCGQKKFHKGAIYCIAAVGDTFMTGGKDKKLRLFKDGDWKNCVAEVKLWAYPRGLDFDAQQDKIIVGCKDGIVYEYGYTTGQQNQVLMWGHSEGEIWGLDINRDQPNIVVTTADDNKICVWDMEKRERLCKSWINSKRGPKKKNGKGASTFSRKRPNQQARSVVINPKNGNVIVACNNGEIQVRASIDDLDNCLQTINHTTHWIEVMRISPDGKWLAVGAHDQRLRIYDLSTMKKVGQNKKHSSYIHCIDWSQDSEGLRTVCGAYELLYHTKEGTQLPAGRSQFKDEIWDTQTCKFGWYVDGIYPGGCDGTHVNGTSRSPDESIMVTATDFGEVNLFRNPCRMGSQAKIYLGHSEHVVRAKFSYDGKNLYSIGGQDKAIIHWEVC